VDRLIPTLSHLAIARLVAALVLVLIVVLNVSLVGTYNRRYERRLYPGVHIAGLQVGGLFRSEAADLVQEKVTQSLNQGIILVYGEQSWTVTAAQAGLRYRIEQACDEAWALGRDSWWERERLEWEPQDIPLEAEARADHLSRVINQVATSVNRPAIAPTILWQDNHWEIAPGQDGRHVLRDDLVDSLIYVLTILANGERPPEGSFIVIDVPTITETATLSPEMTAQIQRQLDRIGEPLTLHCEGHSWTLEAADLASWTRVELLSPEGDASLEIDRLALRDHLSTLAPEIARPVERPRIEVNSDGRVTAFQTGQPGLRLELGEAVEQVEQALRQRLDGEAVTSVELPTEVIPPGDDALMDELGVVEFVGEGTSTFVGSSSARSTNILIGGQELHGRLIAPGEVFSFNAAIDPVSWEKGYQMSPIIVGGGVVMGLGGGLCQVATTFYRAALYTGLEIVERHPHAWRVDWYEQDAPPGFDATIAIGGPDLKVRNNTGRYLLIQVDTRLDLGYQTFRFYGTSPGWNVTVDNVSIMSGGHDVSYVRTVTDAEGMVLWQETIYSHYQ
jgi:vancomycin resistance protein YoaR